MLSLLRIPDLTRRSAQSELMDDASSDIGALYRTLRHFAVINRFFSRTHVLFKRELFRDMKKRGLNRVTIADIGAGGGDFARWCVWFLRRRRVGARVLCIDNDPRVIGYLHRTCAAFPEIEIVHASALRLDTLTQRADYIVSTHVLHHFADEQIPAVIAGAFTAARYGMLFNDLVRHPMWYVFFSIVAGLFFHRSFTFKDGLTSIRKGFTRAEVSDYIERSGLTGRVRVGRSALGHFCLHAIK